MLRETQATRPGKVVDEDGGGGEIGGNGPERDG